MSDEQNPGENSPAESGDIGSSDTVTNAAKSAAENLDVSHSPEATPDLEHNPDNRNHARVNVDRPMLIHCSNGETVKARLVNLSVGGLAFEYPAPAENGATLVVLFQLTKKAEPVNIQAEGIAQHSHIKADLVVTGIQFTKISEEHIDIIEDFVEYKLSSAAQLTGFAVSHRHKS